MTFGAPRSPALHRSTLISLGALRMAASSRRPTAATSERIFVSSIRGWSDLARDATEAIEHWSGDGQQAGLRRSGGRIVQLLGFVRGTPIDVAEAKDELAAAGGLLVVDDRGRLLAREATVRVTGLTWEETSPVFDRFTMTLVADDPLRYSTESLLLRNGGNTIVNAGTREAWPLLDVTGPHGLVTISHAGGTWSLEATPSGVQRLVDLREGDVWQGGVRVFGLESGPAPVAARGENPWTVSGLGSGMVRARRFEAWP